MTWLLKILRKPQVHYWQYLCQNWIFQINIDYLNLDNLIIRLSVTHILHYSYNICWICGNISLWFVITQYFLAGEGSLQMEHAVERCHKLKQFHHEVRLRIPFSIYNFTSWHKTIEKNPILISGNGVRDFSCWIFGLKSDLLGYLEFFHSIDWCLDCGVRFFPRNLYVFTF